MCAEWQIKAVFQENVLCLYSVLTELGAVAGVSGWWYVKSEIVGK